MLIVCRPTCSYVNNFNIGLHDRQAYLTSFNLGLHDSYLTNFNIGLHDTDDRYRLLLTLIQAYTMDTLLASILAYTIAILLTIYKVGIYMIDLFNLHKYLIIAQVECISSQHYNRAEKNSSNDVAMATIAYASRVLTPQQQQQEQVDNRLS